MARPQQYPRFAHHARRAIAGSGPPTTQIGIRAHRSEIDELSAQSALELALRIGEAMLAIGAAAADVSATVLRVAAAYGLRRCQIDITYTSLTVSWSREDAVPLTGMRIVHVRATDYHRLHGLTDLVRSINARELTIEQAHRQLDAVLSAAHPYRRWVVTASLALAAGAVGVLLGGGWMVAVFAGATTAGISILQRALSEWGLPVFFQQAVGGAVATTVAVLLVVLELDLRASLVVGAGIVILLAGLSLVGAAEDAISGFYVTAAARGFEVVMLTAGIVVGIAAVLDVAGRMGIPLAILDPVAVGVPTPLQLTASAGVAAFFAVSSYARPRHVLIAALVGTMSWATFSLLREVGVGAAVASALAAAAVGFAGDVVSDRLRMPPLVVAMSGILPLLPGLTIYRGLFEVVVDGDTTRGLSLLSEAGAIGLGLAAGVTLGEFLATPVRSELDRWDERVRRRASGGRD